MTAQKPTSWNQQRRLAIQGILHMLGKRICRERKGKGFSQEGFADACGLHRTQMGLLERGKAIPRLDTLLLVSKPLGLSVSELLRGIES
jgi:transcriptional regulator with XRE-family HTH domain